ncbi:MAG: YtxH domain-containing protein [Thermoflexales bacterium]
MKNEKNQPKSRINRPGSFVAGAILGGLAGAIAMLLMAQQSGKKTRDQIELKTFELRDKASDAVDEVVTQTRDKARQISSDLRAKAREIQQSGEQLLAEQKARMNNAVADGKLTA